MSNKENIVGNIPVFGPGRRNTGPMGIRGGKEEFVKGSKRGSKGKPAKGSPPKAPKAPKAPKKP